MPYLFVRQKVKDYDRWFAVFDSHDGAQRAAGLMDRRVYRDAFDPGVVVCVFRVADAGDAVAFTEAPEASAAQADAGVLGTPEVLILDDVRAQNEIDRIRTQMRQALVGEAWLGVSILEILDDVDAKTATARPLPGAHSIWEIVLHLTGTQELMLHRLRGIAKHLSPEEDWPPVTDTGADAWQAAVDKLRQGDERIREAVTGLALGRLDEPLVPGGTSAYNNLHGYIQHNLYHAGQISLLRGSQEKSSEESE